MTARTGIAYALLVERPPLPRHARRAQTLVAETDMLGCCIATILTKGAVLGAHHMLWEWHIPAKIAGNR